MLRFCENFYKTPHEWLTRRRQMTALDRDGWIGSQRLSEVLRARCRYHCYLLCMHDLGDNVRNYLLTFADDTTLFTLITNEQC